MKNGSSRSNSQPGQDLLEFGLLISIFLILVLGVIEFGSFVYFLSSLNSASRNSVRYAIGENNLLDCSGIQASANVRSIPMIGTFDSVNIEYIVDGAKYSCGESFEISTGDSISVTVTSTCDPIIPLFNFLQGDYSANSERSPLINFELPES